MITQSFGDKVNVRKEAVQVAVMAIRVAIEGDNTFTDYRIGNGLDIHCPDPNPDAIIDIDKRNN